jgi:hypothetical protein
MSPLETPHLGVPSDTHLMRAALPLPPPHWRRREVCSKGATYNARVSRGAISWREW